MILSNAQKDFVISFALDKDFPADKLAMMMQSTVRLDVGQYFKASGVIFNVKNNVVEILTAAHNLMSWKGLAVPPADWPTLAAEFLANLTVRYGTKASAFNSVPGVPVVNLNKKTDSVVVPNTVNKCNAKDKNPNCYYDLAVITVVDTKLSALAKDCLGKNYKLTDVAEYASGKAASFLDKSKNMYFQLGYGAISETRTPQYLAKDNDGKTIQQIAVGNVEEAKCGDKTLMTAYSLHYRIAEPLNAGQTCFYDQVAAATKAPVYSANCAAMEFAASKNNSTAPGDSGGPLYVIEATEVETPDPNTGTTKTKWTYDKAILLGLTTGSDMQPGKTLTDGVFKNDIVTSVIPYLATRTKG